MSKQTWEEALKVSIVDATQIANSTSETIMVPDTSIPAGYFEPGRSIRVKLVGVLSNVVTTPGTLTIRARLGGVAGTLLAASDALALNIVAGTNKVVAFEFLIICRATGFSATSGTLMTSGEAKLGTARVAANTGQVDMIPSITNAAVASLDLASASTLSFTAQFSVSTNPTNLTIQQFVLEALN